MQKTHGRLILILASILSLSQLARSQEPNIHSAVWLERGCISLAFVAENGRWIEGESQTGAQVQLWINGWISGVNSMIFSTDPAPEIARPPKGWNDGRVIAPLILDFMRKNPKIPPTAKSNHVLTAWYLTTHPKATDEHKRIAGNIIAGLINGSFSD